MDKANRPAKPYLLTVCPFGPATRNTLTEAMAVTALATATIAVTSRMDMASTASQILTSSATLVSIETGTTVEAEAPEVAAEATAQATRHTLHRHRDLSKSWPITSNLHPAWRGFSSARRWRHNVCYSKGFCFCEGNEATIAGYHAGDSLLSTRVALCLAF